MKKNNPDIPSFEKRPQGGAYESPRRRLAIARQAVYLAFEDAMTKSDMGFMSRDVAIERVRTVRPHIMNQFGFEDNDA